MEAISSWWSGAKPEDSELNKESVPKSEVGGQASTTTTTSTSTAATLPTTDLSEQKQQNDKEQSKQEGSKDKPEEVSAAVDMVEEQSQLDGIVHDLEDVSKKALSAAKEWGGRLLRYAAKDSLSAVLR